eukprot:6944069-Pyramimonas_sp.AAC.1
MPTETTVVCVVGTLPRPENHGPAGKRNLWSRCFTVKGAVHTALRTRTVVCFPLFPCSLLLGAGPCSPAGTIRVKTNKRFVQSATPGGRGGRTACVGGEVQPAITRYVASGGGAGEARDALIASELRRVAIERVNPAEQLVTEAQTSSWHRRGCASTGELSL